VVGERDLARFTGDEFLGDDCFNNGRERALVPVGVKVRYVVLYHRLGIEVTRYGVESKLVVMNQETSRSFLRDLN
jgi:hypothetical protein